MPVLLANAVLAGAVASPIAFTTVARGTLSGISAPREVVVRAPREWTAIWEEHAPGVVVRYRASRPPRDAITAQVITLTFPSRHRTPVRGTRQVRAS